MSNRNKTLATVAAEISSIATVLSTMGDSMMVIAEDGAE